MMKYFIQFLVFIVISQFSLGQSDEEETPKKTLIFNDIANQKDIWSLEFGSATLINSSVNTSRFNFVTGLDYFYEINLNNENSISLALGLGYRYASLSFAGGFTNDFDSTDNSSFTKYSQSNISNSRLNNHKVRVPVELRFFIKNSVKVYIGYGLEFNVGMNNRYTLSENKVTNKDFNDSYVINNSIKLRIGFKDVFFFSSYNFNSYFNNSNSPRINTIEFGLSFGG